MKVEQIMTTDVVTVSMDERLRTVQEIFDKRKFHHILIIEDSELVGIVSDRDLLKEISPFIATVGERPQDLSTLEKRMHQIMSRKPITAEKDMTIEEAATLFVEKNISCLPILSCQDAIIGIVTWKDILKKFLLQREDLKT